MNIKINTNLLLLFFFYIVNCAMIAPHQVPSSQNSKNTSAHTALQQERDKNEITKIKQKRFRKRIKRIKNVVDGGALLIALGAVIVMAIAVYYFFSLGFFTGVLALIAAAFLLYLLFQYLEY